MEKEFKVVVVNKEDIKRWAVEKLSSIATQSSKIATKMIDEALKTEIAPHPSISNRRVEKLSPTTLKLRRAEQLSQDIYKLLERGSTAEDIERLTEEEKKLWKKR